MTKIYIVHVCENYDSPRVINDVGIFADKKSADAKFNELKSYNQLDPEDFWISEYELNDQGQYKFVKAEGLWELINKYDKGETE